MYLKEGYKDALKNIFKLTYNLDEFKSRMSYDEFKKEFILFKGDEAKIIKKNQYPLKCKGQFKDKDMDLLSRCSKENLLPCGFLDSLPQTFRGIGGIPIYKEKFFTEILTQGLYEKDPIKVLELSRIHACRPHHLFTDIVILLENVERCYLGTIEQIEDHNQREKFGYWSNALIRDLDIDKEKIRQEKEKREKVMRLFKYARFKLPKEARKKYILDNLPEGVTLNSQFNFYQEKD